MGYSKRFKCSFAALIFLACFMATCARNGKEKDNVTAEQGVGGGEDQTQDLEEDLSKVRAFFFHEELTEDQICEAVEPLSAWGQLKDFSLDGRAQEWADVGTSAYAWLDHGVNISARMAHHTQGLALFLDYPWQQGDELKITFHALSKENSFITINRNFQLSFTDANVLLVGDDHSQILGPELADFRQSLEGLEIFISDFLLDGVQFYPVWFMELEIVSEDRRVLFPTQVRRSLYPGNQDYNLQSCEISWNARNYTIHRVFSDSLPSQTASLLEKLMLNQAQTLAPLLPERENVILVHGPMSSATLEALKLAGVLGVNTRSWRYGENRRWDNSILTQQIIQQQVETHLKRYAGYFAHWSKSLSVLSSFHTFKNKLGMFSYLQALAHQRSQMADYSPEQLGLYLSIFADQLDLTSLLTWCQSQQGLLHICIIETLLGHEDGEQLIESWSQGQSTLGALEPWRLLDIDGDGVPGGLESQFQTDDSYPDTDFDGWSDLSEIFMGTDPRVPVNHPDGLLIDGNMGDWFNLIPVRVQVDQDEDLGSCADINIAYYSAILIDQSLFISAKLSKKNQSSFKWEVSMQQENAELLLFEISNNSSSYGLKGGYHIDLPYLIQGGELEIYKAVNAKASELKIQIRVYEGVKFCDDSPWFEPAQSAL